MSEPPLGPVDGLVVEVRGSALWVLLNRPQVHNALTVDMYEGIRNCCELAEHDESIRSLVITGFPSESPTFAAGSDIGELAMRGTWDEFRTYEDSVADTLRRLRQARVPTIAAVAGPCIGAGATIALSCDIRVIARSTRLGYPLAKTVGGCLPMETYALLAEHLGTSRSLDMLLTARLFGADELQSCGVATRLVEDADLHSDTQDLADRMATFAPLSLRAAKTAFGRLRELLTDDWNDDIRREIYHSADFTEGITAFRERRTPVWSGT